MIVNYIRLDIFGDLGIFLKTHLFSDENYVLNNPKESKQEIELWRDVMKILFFFLVIILPFFFLKPFFSK